MTYEKAVEYARASVKRGNSDAPKYVKKQLRIFLEIADKKDKKYIVDKNKCELIDNILKLLVMPKGVRAGEPLINCICNYQQVLFIAALAVVHADNTNRRRYETILLEICRKNFKTFTIAVLFILLFFLEPQFSRFFSVAPDGALSREVKQAIEEILLASPLVFASKKQPRFKILRDSIKFLVKNSVYVPLNYSNSRLDGRLANAFLADEVGALPNAYAIEAMRSGQIGIVNKLACIISTKYETKNNPFEDEVDYAKRVLDKIIEDETIFALLYEPDDTKHWTTNDTIMKQGNPAALENSEIWESLIKKRARAIAIPATRENFLTKHCNIIYQGVGTESFVDINDVLKCRIQSFDWSGRTLYIGVDLAETNDNCAVAIVTEENGEIYADVIAFIPEGRIDEKNAFEHIDYRLFIDAMKCIACGNKTVDYNVIEGFVFNIEQAYGGVVQAIGYDRHNALSSAQKWEKGDDDHVGMNCVMIRQHSDTLHPPTKLLSEKIENTQFHYLLNTLLEINFENARCTRDTNLNRYVNKKRSNGKVDMVVALINAIFLLQQDVIFEDGFISQSI